MRTFTRTLAGIALALLLTPSNAQAQLSVALAYGTDTELGVQLGYGIDLPTLPVGGRVSVTGYLPDSNDGVGLETTVYYFDFAAEALYSLAEFIPSDQFDVYAVGGLNYSYARVTIDTDLDIPGLNDGGNGEAGLSLGAGATFTKFFGEARLGLGGFEQVMLTVGIRL